MKFFNVLALGVLLTSQCIMSDDNHGVYYQELQALENNPITSILFDEDRDGGSHTNQCNLGLYEPYFLHEDAAGLFSELDGFRRGLALGAIHRDLTTAKKLSFLNYVLQLGLSGINAELLIVTPETMPSLYNYVADVAEKANIANPVVFISLKEGLFKAYSRKILMFPGSIVIGQQLVRNVSDDELRALVAQEIGHIKYHHTSKKFALDLAFAAAFFAALRNSDNKVPYGNVISCLIVPALSYLVLGKKFEKQVDTFASEIAGASAGIIKFYERLQGIDQARDKGFDTLLSTIKDSRSEMSILAYMCFMAEYYMAKAENSIAKVFNKYAYPSHQDRIDDAQKYLA